LREPRTVTRLADVAARAGVSINTVSRALRAPATVRPQVRERIAEALDALDYVPNRLAGMLAGGRSEVVGVIISSLFYSEYAATIDAMQEALAVAGLGVMLGNSRYDLAEELRLVRAMLSWRPAALALVGVDHHPKSGDLLRRAGIPVVEFWDTGHAPLDSVVGMDHGAIGAGQARHLVDCGAVRVGFAGAVREHDYRAKKRLAGCRAAVEAAGRGLPVATEAVAGHPDLGEALLGRLLGEEPRIDGIVCNSDVIAMGVVRGLKRRGRRVPEDVRVIGFGDNVAATCLEPTLSTVRPPRVEIGRATAEAILARIGGGPQRRVTVAAELVARGSTGGDAVGQPAELVA
jgi:LacI family gluconate utilization system Gnt-I transcriptional repressor